MDMGYKLQSTKILFEGLELTKINIKKSNSKELNYYFELRLSNIYLELKNRNIIL